MRLTFHDKAHNFLSSHLTQEVIGKKRLRCFPHDSENNSQLSHSLVKSKCHPSLRKGGNYPSLALPEASTDVFRLFGRCRLYCRPQHIQIECLFKLTTGCNSCCHSSQFCTYIALCARHYVPGTMLNMHLFTSFNYHNTTTPFHKRLSLFPIYS